MNYIFVRAHHGTSAPMNLAHKLILRARMIRRITTLITHTARQHGLSIVTIARRLGKPWRWVYNVVRLGILPPDEYRGWSIVSDLGAAMDRQIDVKLDDLQMARRMAHLRRKLGWEPYTYRFWPGPRIAVWARPKPLSVISWS